MICRIQDNRSNHTAPASPPAMLELKATENARIAAAKVVMRSDRRWPRSANSAVVWRISSFRCSGTMMTGTALLSSPIVSDEPRRASAVGSGNWLNPLRSPLLRKETATTSVHRKGVRKSWSWKSSTKMGNDTWLGPAVHTSLLREKAEGSCGRDRSTFLLCLSFFKPLGQTTAPILTKIPANLIFGNPKCLRNITNRLAVIGHPLNKPGVGIV